MKTLQAHPQIYPHLHPHHPIGEAYDILFSVLWIFLLSGVLLGIFKVLRHTKKKKE
jgi:hypothetical protein